MTTQRSLISLWSAMAAVAVVLSACSGATAATDTPPPPASSTAAPPAATSTPLPPAATASLVPPTATTVPSPTPDLAATAAAEATATAAPILAMIDGELQEYGLSTEQGHLGWLHEPYTAELDEYMEYDYYTDYPEVTASDFALHADIGWETTTGLAGCGFLLRAEPNFKRGLQYQFAIVRLAGSPLWDIEYFKNGQFQYNLTGLRAAPALDEGLGAVNGITVIVQGNRFMAYANGQELGAASDTKLTEGTVAFLSWQESGRTTCTFENAWLWIFKD